MSAQGHDKPRDRIDPDSVVRMSLTRAEVLLICRALETRGNHINSSLAGAPLRAILLRDSVDLAELHAEADSCDQLAERLAGSI